MKSNRSAHRHFCPSLLTTYGTTWALAEHEYVLEEAQAVVRERLRPKATRVSMRALVALVLTVSRVVNLN